MVHTSQRRCIRQVETYEGTRGGQERICTVEYTLYGDVRERSYVDNAHPEQNSLEILGVGS